MSGAGTTRSYPDWPPGCRLRSRPAPNSSRSSATRAGTFTLTFSRARGQDGDRRSRRARAAVHRPALVGRLVEGRLHGLKATAIREQGMGTNSKLHVQFTSRFWSAPRFERRDVLGSRLPEHVGGVARPGGSSGILVNYTGGTFGASFGTGTSRRGRASSSASSSPCSRVRPRVERPCHVDFWTGNKWTNGSYSYWKPGQYTEFAGVEGERSGNCHFAGEHTSTTSTGT